MQQVRARRGYYAQLAAIGLLTYLVHEAAHWITGRALGYPVGFSLNGVSSPTAMTPGNHILFSIAGPAVTIAGALAAYAWGLRRHGMTAYAIIYFAFFMRLVATGVSVLTPNDEARVSLLLGLGQWTVPALVVLGLGALTVLASRSLRVSWKVNLLSYVVCSVVIAAIVGIDMAIKA